jgi:hypothetical protein
MPDANQVDPRIRGKLDSRRSGERRVADLAAEQHGVVARRQLLALGFSRKAIDRRVQCGRWHGIYRGVYAVGHRNLTGHGRWMAAVLASGPSALLSHRSAAALWNLLPTSKTLVDVTSIRPNTAGRSGIAIHRVKAIHPDDRALREGIPVTSIARTLLDLSAVAQRRQLERAVEQAEFLGLFDLRAIESLQTRTHRRAGWRQLRATLRIYREPAPTRSELERRFLDLCRDAALPPPAVNAFVAGLEVDFVWHDDRLVVELDGHAFHRTRAAFERDRVRDASLLVAGYRVLRVTHRRLEAEPAAVIAEARALLATAARSG